MKRYLYILTITLLLIGCNSKTNKNKINATNNGPYASCKTLQDSISYLIINNTGFDEMPKRKIKYNKKSIKLNNAAMDKFLALIEITSFEPSFLTYEAKVIDTILTLLDRAIELDSSYHTAYANKVTILQEIGHYDKVVETFETQARIDTNHAEPYVYLALHYEASGEIEKSQESFKKAKDAYLKRRKTLSKKSDIIGSDLDLINLLFIIEGDNSKEKVLELMDTIINRYPENEQSLTIFKEMFLPMNRDDYSRAILFNEIVDKRDD